MQRYKVPDMSCSHCVHSIEKAVKSLDPAAKVACDLDSKLVEITTQAPAEKIAAVLVAAGYEHERLSDAAASPSA